MTAFSVQLFGERLRRRRRACQLTQQALARQLGVGQGWLSELETARQGPVQVNTLVRLCCALTCTSDYLLGLADDPTPRPRRLAAARRAEGDA